MDYIANEAWDYWHCRRKDLREPDDPSQPAPFRFGRLYGSEKYNLQNMLLKAVNAPRQLGKDQRCFEIWSDRISNAQWENAKAGITSTQTGDAFFNGVPDDQFMEFAKRLAVGVGFKGELTGARIVRYTNAMSGYPTLRIDLIGNK